MEPKTAVTWQWMTFADLKLSDLYALMALRQRVFVVEQNSAYLDADGLDREAWHLLVRSGDTLVGTLRVLPPGTRYPDMSIGRVCTASEVRRTGLGLEMMGRAVRRFGDEPLTLSAQLYLRRFYEGFDFVAEGEVYLEDAIPHIKMHRAPTSGAREVTR